MIYSAKLSSKIIKNIVFNKIRGIEKGPYTLMLEPLFKCNLNCTGCGRIREYREVLSQKLSVAECVDAAKQAKASIISITGGEPLIHPQIKEIVNELLKRGYFIYLCTNGLLLSDFVNEIKAKKELSFVVHLDGFSKVHNSLAGADNVFEKAVEGIKKAVKLNFRVITNTTIYKDTDENQILNLFYFLMKLGVQGVLVSPGFKYDSIENRDMFMEKTQICKTFANIFSKLDNIKIYNTPLYWEFLQGKTNLKCMPWSNPTFNVKGWKSPCYLVTDCHFPTYREYIENTPWEKYGADTDERCLNCMMHCGFEASAISNAGIKDLLKILKWNFSGKIS